MLNTSIVSTAVSGLASAVAGMAIAQIPTETEVGEWTKYGFAGACLSVTVYLITVHIPKILELGKQMNETNRQTMEKGFAELGAKFDANSRQQQQMMQTLIDKVVPGRRDG